tara:strand:- start:560 stop:751 length:192 start_codon:yes stop_codon:yes gene_type:complete
MKIYTLTIGVDEENEEVEFIKEEQYNTEPIVNEETLELVDTKMEDDKFESLLERLKLSIVGHA